MYHLFAVNVPSEQRSRAFSYLSAFGSIGQTFVTAACPHIPWRWPFYIFGVAGLIWCLVWMIYYEKSTATVDEEALLYKKNLSPLRNWRKFFFTRPLLAVYFAHFCMNWTAYIIMHWLPTYLHTKLNADTQTLSLACLPYAFNSLCSIGVGHIADSVVNGKHLTVAQVRKLATVIGLVGPALFIFFFAALSHLYAAVIVISVSMGLLAFNSPGHLSNHADLCGKYAGISFAISNTIATLPGLVVGPLTAEFVTQSSGRWWPAFVLAGMLNLTGAVAYLNYGSTKQII
ncbi:unnamed protein product [Soboliphyme baturini]|uniref:MFS domain-containing protein n=1 Tax=Soboliphyme baturini TaxID=241478 RepID=A0A183IVQ4_9BILA|nr:unnamed protein product [Soboliphyme baturini]